MPNQNRPQNPQNNPGKQNKPDYTKDQNQARTGSRPQEDDRRINNGNRDNLNQNRQNQTDRKPDQDDSDDEQ